MVVVDYSLYTALKRHFGDIEMAEWDVPPVIVEIRGRKSIVKY